MDSMEPGTALGPIGNEILFENEFVRIWGVVLEPGGRQPWHRHDLPYVIVPLTAGKNVMTFADGRRRETEEVPGGVLWREAGIPHELLNISDWTYRNVLIEVKTGAAGQVSPAASS